MGCLFPGARDLTEYWRSHGKWHLDPGKLQAALRHVEVKKTSLVIRIDVDNDAFVDRTLPEIKRILAEIVKSPTWSKINEGEIVSLHDSNGNGTGEVLIESPDFSKLVR